MDDPRPDELLDEAGRAASRLQLALAWSDGLEGAAAKSCSRSGTAAWKSAKRLSEDGAAAASFFRSRARKRNPAVVAGASGLVLIEADGELDALLAENGIPPLPPTVGVRSRRGLHRYYRPPAGRSPLKIQLDESGVVASADGYLIGAGALHASGWVYAYENGAEEIAELPVEVYDLLVSLGEQTRERSWLEFATGQPVPEGQRNDWLFHVALGLLRDGIERADVLERLLAVNVQQNRPPLAREFVEKALAGAMAHARKHPTPTERARTEARQVLRGRGARMNEQRPVDELGAAEGWEEPVPLTGRPQAPPFPIDALPGWLRSWSIEIAREKSASVDLAAALGLGVVAGAIARHTQVSPRPGWWEPVNLYLAIALEPGQRKTPIFKAAFRPVRALERARMASWDEQNALVTISEAILDKRRKELVAEAAGDEELDPELLRRRLDGLLEGLGETEPTPRPRLLTEDVTPEGLASLLAEHGRIIAASDEGAAIFENLAGRYARGSTSWDIFNKAHSAADLAVDRKSSGPVIVWDPALTLVIATQPKVLRDLWGKPGAEGRGVLARPLYSFPEPAYEIGRSLPAEAHALAVFETTTRALFDDVPLLALDEEGKPQPLTIRFDTAAELVFERYEEELARERHALGTSEEAEDEAAYLGWLSKLAGQTARLAACLHVADHWTSGVTSNVTLEPRHVENATELARYFHAHARVVFGLMGQLPEQRRALAILRWLRARTDAELDELTVRDVHRTRGKGTRSEEVRTALALLEQHGYVRVERAPRVGKGGRASERVLVHPEIKNRPDRPDKPDTGVPTSGLSGQSGRLSNREGHRP